MTQSYTIGDALDVRIEKIVPRGLGLAFAKDLTVFVPLSVPGDDLRVRVIDIKKRTAFAEIVEIKSEGPDRVVPHCKYFGKCGGCDFQQLSYSAQLKAKVGIIRDCLHRIGKIDYEDEISVVRSPKELSYRSRARWHIDRDRRSVGYFSRGSHDVIDVSSCPKLTPELELAFENFRRSIDWDTLWAGSIEVDAATGDEGRTSIFSREIPEPASELSLSVNGETYAFSAETFFQANKFLITDLIDAALGDTNGDRAFDLYCGVGLFTLPLAKRFGKVIAVEENSAATAFARKNISAANLDNANIICKSVGRFLVENKTDKIDLILIDPPRAGSEKGVIVTIAELNPAQISYVSCEPSILARDLRILLDAGYGINKITALDMFPQTHHVEIVVRLTIS